MNVKIKQSTSILFKKGEKYPFFKYYFYYLIKKLKKPLNPKPHIFIKNSTKNKIDK